MTGSISITLPVPHASLWPNGRSHWRTKAKHTAIHRFKALLATRDIVGVDGPPPVFTGYSLAFLYPDARRRDDDNASASCKAYRDGIADALGVDDSTFRMSELPTFQIDRAHPRVVITLNP